MALVVQRVCGEYRSVSLAAHKLHSSHAEMSMHSPCCQRLYNYVAISLGMTSFHYNTTTGTFKQQLWMQVLALVGNLCTILSLPFIFWDAMERTSAIQWNPTMTYTNYITYSVRTLVVLYTILKRGKSDLVNYEVLRKYRCLRKAYLAQLPRVALIERRMNRLFYAKCINMSILVILTAVIFLQIRCFEWTWSNWYLLVMVVQTTAILHLTIFNFFWLLWSICHSLKYVQWHLRHLLLEMAESVRPGKRWRLNMLVANVQRILEAHWQLSKLARVVTRNYRFLALAVFFDEITSLVRQLYYGIIFTFDHHAELYLLVVGTVYFFAMILDVYLNFLICDITVKTYYACVAQLDSICGMIGQCTALEEIVEKYLLRNLNRNFRLDLCGVIVINRQRWVHVMQRVAYDCLTLVQFHLIFNVNKNFN